MASQSCHTRLEYIIARRYELMMLWWNRIRKINVKSWNNINITAIEKWDNNEDVFGLIGTGNNIILLWA